jgi:lauroyl/myristoyl acyltransferase
MYRISRRDFYFSSVIALLTISRRFPIWIRRLMVRAAAFGAYWISGRKRRLTWCAIDAAFGEELSTVQKRNIAQGAFYQFWGETFWMAPSPAELEQVVRVPLRGEEHLRAALSRGRGAILMETNSFGGRFLARRVLHARGYALHQVHGEKHLGSGFDPGPRWNWAARWFRRFCEACEMECLAEMIYLPKSDSLAFTRVLLDRLKRNCAICISGDGKYSHRLIGLPFLGGEETFSTGMISLARASGAPLLPLFCVSRGSAEIEVIIEAAIDVESSAGREASLIAGVGQFANLLERYCREYPEQFYAWSELASRPAS